MKVFLTGGTGFVGSQLVNRLHREKITIYALRREKSKSRVPASPHDPIWVTRNEMGQVLGDCEAFIHLAAHGVDPKDDDWHECFRFNISESLEMWLAGVQAGIRQFIICGSCYEYGRSGGHYHNIPADAPLAPTGPYHASKASASMAAIALAVKEKVAVQILRPFQIYGEGERPGRLWPSLRLAALKGEDFPMTAGEQVRDFTPVELISEEFCESLIRKGYPGRAILRNLGTGKPMTVLEFSKRWWKEWKGTGKLLAGELPYRSDEVMRYVPDLRPVII